MRNKPAPEERFSLKELGSGRNIRFTQQHPVMKALFPGVRSIVIEPISDESGLRKRNGEEDITSESFKLTPPFDLLRVNRKNNPKKGVSYRATFRKSNSPLRVNDYDLHEALHALQVILHKENGIEINPGSFLDLWEETLLRYLWRPKELVSPAVLPGMEEDHLRKNAAIAGSNKVIRLLPEEPERRFQIIGELFRENAEDLRKLGEIPAPHTSSGYTREQHKVAAYVFGRLSATITAKARTAK